MLQRTQWMHTAAAAGSHCLQIRPQRTPALPRPMEPPPYTLNSIPLSTVLPPFCLQARFLLCSETPQPGIRDLIGLGSLLQGRSGSSGGTAGQAGRSEGGSGGGAAQLFGQLAAGGGEEGYYLAARSAVQAAMDEAEERAIWGRFKVH